MRYGSWRKGHKTLFLCAGISVPIHIMLYWNREGPLTELDLIMYPGDVGLIKTFTMLDNQMPNSRV